MPLDNVVFAFVLTLCAGLATGIGGAIAFLAKRTNTKLLSFALGLSAGVMIYVSFVEILFKAKEALVLQLGNAYGGWATIGSFFGGIAFIGIIDMLVPAFENPHELRRVEEVDDSQQMEKQRKLYRMGIFSAIAIAIHNFPEGLATFAAALKDPQIGFPIAIAIAIHNIPEGIAIAIPIYYAVGSKKKAFFYSFLSGLAEPLGALIGFGFFLMFFTDIMFGIVFAAVAGIMVYISLDELLPAAREYGKGHLAIGGLICGMLIMAISLVLFQ
ncbi:MAG: zinc transporter ZupT [Candidatus Ancaeobacter aquaticus]|nr:zinc transporter ZupT [Candidatus Ancaeobacter aquaticus]